MRSLFCPTHRAKNNEEYRAVLKKRQVTYCLLILTGTATAGLTLFLHFCTQITIAEYRLGYLIGLGIGLVLGGAFGVAQIRRRMASEEKLKEFRLKETDEREIAVAGLALQATAKTLLAALYVMLIAAGVFGREELIAVGFALLTIFLVGYAAFRKYYDTKL